MQIFRVTDEETARDIAAKAYGLGANDPVLVNATKNLILANPSLPGNLSKLPKGTVVAIPPLDGKAPSAGATNVDPLAAGFRLRLQILPTAAAQAALQRNGGGASMNFALGKLPISDTTPLAQLDLSVLQQDLAAFIKLYDT